MRCQQALMRKRLHTWGIGEFVIANNAHREKGRGPLAEYKGIKRNEALHPLSHHHTQALHMALKLKRAGTDKSALPPEEIKRELKVFWKTKGNAHFRQEEEVLLPAFAMHEDLEEIPEVSKMLLQHVEIRALIQYITGVEEPDIIRMRQLGKLLGRHIRLEERVIFPMIENTLSQEELDQLHPHFAEG